MYNYNDPNRKENQSYNYSTSSASSQSNRSLAYSKIPHFFSPVNYMDNMDEPHIPDVSPLLTTFVTEQQNQNQNAIIHPGVPTIPTNPQPFHPQPPLVNPLPNPTLPTMPNGLGNRYNQNMRMDNIPQAPSYVPNPNPNPILPTPIPPTLILGTPIPPTPIPAPSYVPNPNPDPDPDPIHPDLIHPISIPIPISIPFPDRDPIPTDLNNVNQGNQGNQGNQLNSQEEDDDSFLKKLEKLPPTDGNIDIPLPPLPPLPLELNIEDPCPQQNQQEQEEDDPLLKKLEKLPPTNGNIDIPSPPLPPLLPLPLELDFKDPCPQENQQNQQKEQEQQEEDDDDSFLKKLEKLPNPLNEAPCIPLIEAPCIPLPENMENIIYPTHSQDDDPLLKKISNLLDSPSTSTNNHDDNDDPFARQLEKDTLRDNHHQQQQQQDVSAEKVIYPSPSPPPPPLPHALGDSLLKRMSEDNQPLFYHKTGIPDLNAKEETDELVKLINQSITEKKIPLDLIPPFTREIPEPVFINNTEKWIDNLNRFVEGNMNVKGLQGNGVLYYKNNKKDREGVFVNSKLNGEGVIYWEKEEKVRYKGMFVNDVLEGEGEEYDENNRLIYAGEFKDGLYHGKGEAYFDNYRYCGSFEEGKREGNGVTYDGNGNICEEGYYYQNNLSEGKVWQNGFIVNEGEFLNGYLVEGIIYRPNSTIKLYEGSFEKGVPHGFSDVFDENGNKSYRIHYNHGVPDGQVYKFFPQKPDQVQAAYFISNNQKNGEYIEYNEEGEKVIKTFFVNDCEHGKRIEYLGDENHYREIQIENNQIKSHYHEFCDGRMCFTGAITANQYENGSIFTYKELPKELVCYKQDVHNFQISNVMTVYATMNKNSIRPDEEWLLVFKGYYEEKEGQLCRTGKGLFYSEFKTMECSWYNNKIERSVTVYENTLENSNKRRSWFVGTVVFDDSESMLHPTLQYVDGCYYYEDGSYFKGHWNNMSEVVVEDNKIVWPNGDVKYFLTSVKQYEILDLSIPHEYLPSGEVCFFPLGHRCYVRGVFDAKKNCVASPVSYYETATHSPLTVNRIHQYTRHSDGYNYEYDYPYGY